MLASLLALALAPIAVGADLPLASGLQLTYRGTVAQLNDDRSPGTAEKTFDLSLLLAGVGTDDARVYWRVDERGKGAWPWIERFGSVRVSADWQPDDSPLPALLYDRGEGMTVIPLHLPFLHTEEALAEDKEWADDHWSYRVAKGDKLDGREVWQVQVSNNYGLKRTLLVDRGGDLAPGMNERVFMGMGQEYDLQLRLVAAEQLPGNKAQAAVASYDAMIGLRTKLNRPPRDDSRDFNEKQLAVLAELLPDTEKQVTEPALAKLVRAARKDVEQQNSRASAVDKLAAEYEGRELPEFNLEGSSKEKLSAADMKGHVTVLHFWDYRDAPMEEPYGQVGYLDFLCQRRQADGVKVYGVAVDGRLADDDKRAAAIRGVRKFKSFMNLSYPVMLDGGAFIKEFGDPRLIGAELPLFVVIGADGTIQHYHVGYYEVDRNEGLKALNEAVGAAVNAGK
ncbi:MAG: TlpA family protein disulfide reductase [Pirellulales bacterium]